MRVLQLRMKERTAEVLDWIDYRPDPHWWPIAGVAVLFAIAYLALPAFLWQIMLAVAGVVSIVCLLLMALGTVVLVAGRIVRDLMVYRTRTPFERQPHTMSWQIGDLHSKTR